MNSILIGIGAALGAVLRYWTSRAFARFGLDQFPWATFAVNIAGCFAIGLTFGLWAGGTQMSERTQLALTTGFLGGLTTFSTFGYEVVTLLHNRPMSGLLYPLASVLVGGAACLLGLRLGHAL